MIVTTICFERYGRLVTLPQGTASPIASIFEHALEAARRQSGIDVAIVGRKSYEIPWLRQLLNKTFRPENVVCLTNCKTAAVDVFEKTLLTTALRGYEHAVVVGGFTTIIQSLNKADCVHCIELNGASYAGMASSFSKSVVPSTACWSKPQEDPTWFMVTRDVRRLVYETSLKSC